MSKLSLQNRKIIREMNKLIINLAFDGRSLIKIRFRKIKNTTNQYIIEASCGDSKLSSIITLENTPFSISWLFSIKKIKEGINIPYCRKSRYGGYTFYN